MLLDFYNKTTMQMASLYNKFVVWMFCKNTNGQTTSLHNKFIAQNGKHKYGRCLEYCKIRNVDFEQFLLATIYPKDNNSRNIYNLVDGMVKQINNVDNAKIQICCLADFIRKVKIKNWGYIAHWINLVLHSIIHFNTRTNTVDIEIEDAHCLCNNLMEINMHDTHSKMMFVLQKYGWEKCYCNNYCGIDALYKVSIELCNLFPVYGYFNYIRWLRQSKHNMQNMHHSMRKYIAMFEHLLHHVELYENRQTCNALGYMHCELQKMKCDANVEYVLADEYVVARICRFFN